MDLVTLDRDRPLLEGAALPRDPAPLPLRDLSPRSVHRWAIQHGCSDAEAGNWAAYCAGIPLVEGEDLPQHAWSLRAVQHLLFLRELVGSGRLEP